MRARAFHRRSGSIRSVFASRCGAADGPQQRRRRFVEACHTRPVADPTRRRMLQTVAGALGWAASGTARAAPGPGNAVKPAAAASPAGDDALDEALRR